MQVGKANRILFLILLCLAVVLPGACTYKGGSGRVSEMQEFDSFFSTHSDSVVMAPRWMKAQALQRMERTKDSMVRYNYLAVALKTCLATSDFDSAQLLLRQVEAFAGRQPFSHRLADLQSECFNIKGNVYSRKGYIDSAAVCFKEAYEARLKGTKFEVIPDILINLADATNHLGRPDMGAFWYRKALLMCDSLKMPYRKKISIYYGLSQGYLALRDYEQCDYYSELAGKNYADMFPDEKHFYLNNRGNSYYYRGDYSTAIGYFRKVVELVKDYPDMSWALNLSYLNLSDCFLQLNKTDSVVKYLELCQPFFEELGSTTALYYIDTQKIELALQRKDFAEARRLLTMSKASPEIDADMIHIRNKYLQQFYEETGNYRQAYDCQKENKRLDDSIRNERIRMRTADLTLRYQQDSTLMAHKVLFQKQENEMLILRQTRLVTLAVAVIALLIAAFLYLYNRKKRDLLLAQNRRTVSTLRLENIRNRLSPHFIFNVLNQEVVNRKEEEKQELVSLVKLMRRNLELAEQLCVTLAEELDFVKTYIDLERRSLGATFHPVIEIAGDVLPEQVWLPSMMIQIPVENSVKHALRGKEGERNLWIAADRREGGVCIRITDNGGGYHPESRNRGTGTGMKVIMQTIQILNMKNQAAIDISVHNVTLPSGETGCEVTFLLPDKYDYRI